MAEPDWNPDTGGRSLAEILREAGIESANRAARRRTWDDPEETGIRQRRAEAAAAGRAPELGRRRKSDRSLDEALDPVPGRRAATRSAGRPPNAAGRRPARDAPRRAGPVDRGDPRLRPDRKPGVPVGGARCPARPCRRARAPGRRARGPHATAGRPRRRAPAPGGRPAEPHPTPVPSPSSGPSELDGADDLDSTPHESALAWLRFAGELIIALAAGVGVYFAATLLWENVPHVAVLLAPLAVTGLVTGVGCGGSGRAASRWARGCWPILVFAGTLLTIAPAAGLLAGLLTAGGRRRSARLVLLGPRCRRTPRRSPR